MFIVSPECFGTPRWVRASVSSTLLERDDAEYEDGLDADRMKPDGYSAARVDRPDTPGPGRAKGARG